MTYRILVTGSRAWTDYNTLSKSLAIEVTNAMRSGLDVVVVHGDCPTGADAMAQRFCEENDIETERHPADWSVGKKAGPLRNQHMVDLGADICLAYPIAGSRGTLHCMKAAKTAGIPVVNLGV